MSAVLQFLMVVQAWQNLVLARFTDFHQQALVLIAPAIDVTTYWWEQLSEEEQRTALAERQVPLRSEYQASQAQSTTLQKA